MGTIFPCSCETKKANEKSVLAATYVDANENKVAFLSKVELFKRLPKDDLPALAAKAEEIDFQLGSTIIKQGEQGNDFFIIMDGTAVVSIDGSLVAFLGPTDYFGETALLRDEDRTASVVAKGKLKALRVTRVAFNELGLESRLDFKRRDVVVGAQAPIKNKPPSSKTEEDTKIILDALQGNPMFSDKVLNLSYSTRMKIASLMWEETVESQEPIIVQGDLVADYFYIVKSGSFSVEKNIDIKTQKAEHILSCQEKLGTISKGGCFGELALLYSAPRAATIIAEQRSRVWVLDRTHFRMIMTQADEDRVVELRLYFDKLDIFRSLTDSEKDTLLKSMQEQTFSKGEEIVKEGKLDDMFYVLIDGEVEVFKRGISVARLKHTRDFTPYFGEKALTGEPRDATVKALSPGVHTLAIDKSTFEMVIGPIEDINQRGKFGSAVVMRTAMRAASKNKTYGVIKRIDLDVIGVIGIGGFGDVQMVRLRGTTAMYALKRVSKGFIVKTGIENNLMNEKAVLLMCKSPFVIKMLETYNGDENLYFLLELCGGGELYNTYHRKKLFGNEACAKYYSAGVALALHHMHGLKVVYRDLKPENLLLTSHGHIKVADMGLAKVLSAGKTFTVCGTPDYFSPEMIESKGYNRAVDWWALGVLVFELFVGHPPFESGDQMQTYQKVKAGIKQIAFPSQLQSATGVLIKALCNPIALERPPMKKGDLLNLKRHHWYKDFSWEDFESFQMIVPYKPNEGRGDLGVRNMANFNPREMDRPPQVPYSDPLNGWDRDFATCGD